MNVIRNGNVQDNDHNHDDRAVTKYLVRLECQLHDQEEEDEGEVEQVRGFGVGDVHVSQNEDCAIAQVGAQRERKHT